MKLYATVTSERASKGQGGNKRCDTVFSVERMGERLEVVKVLMQHNEDNSYRIVVLLPHHQSTETVLKMNEHNNLYCIEERVRADQKNYDCPGCGATEQSTPGKCGSCTGLTDEEGEECTHQNCDDEGNCHACDVNVFKEKGEKKKGEHKCKASETFTNKYGEQEFPACICMKASDICPNCDIPFGDCHC